MACKTPKRWITSLIAQSDQPGPLLPWHRAAKCMRRKTVVSVTRQMELA